MKLVLFLVFILAAFPVWAQKKVAVVKLLKGDAEVLTMGKTTKLKLDDWVESGSIVRTQDKSFVKLIFIDKSQMNVGPNSEMKIESFTGKDSGVIDLVKGKIRSQVSKDYLQMQDKDKSKLFIKTQNAVMGVRGTDFMIATNGKNTSTVLFSGEVVFNRLDERGQLSSAKLEEVVNRGVRIFPGEFSVMEVSRTMPTVPALLNIQQKESLEKNETFEGDRVPSNTEKVETKSVVPAGLDGKIVSNSGDVLKNEVKEVIKTSSLESKSPSGDPDGYVKGDKIKPANGSFVHVDSGIIIPPGPDSVLDSNTNTYIPGQKSGSVSADGNYIPPKNIEITPDGKILVAVTDSNGVTQVQEIEPPLPTMDVTVAIGDVSGVLSQNPELINTTTVVTNDILDAQFAPSGLTDLSNNQLNSSGGISGVNDPTISTGTTSNTTVIVTPNGL